MTFGVGTREDFSFSNCGWNCLHNARSNSDCHTNNNIQCMCENADARKQASTCMSDRCSSSDVHQFSQAMGDCNEDIAEPGQTTHSLSLTPTSTMRTTVGAPIPTTTTTTTITTENDPAPTPTETSGSTCAGDDDSPILSAGIHTGPAFSTSGMPALSSSPPPESFSTDEASLNTPSGTSNATTAVAASPTQSTNGSSPPTLPITSDADSRGLSSKAAIMPFAALGITTFIAIVVAGFIYIRRRRRRLCGHGTLPVRLPAYIRPDDSDEGSVWERNSVHEAATRNVHLTAGPAVVHSSPAAPILAPNRPSSIQTLNDLIISPTTTPHSPHSDSGDKIRPLLRHVVSDGPCVTRPIRGAPSSRRASSALEYGSDTWSRYDVVGEATQAHRETVDFRNARGARAVDHRTSGDILKMAPNDRPFATRRRRPSLPAIPVQPPSPTVLPAGTTATLSSGTHGPRFVPVTVLMEVREDGLEEQDQPPPYQPPPQELVGTSYSTPIETEERGAV